MLDLIINGILIGAGATIVMDVWALILAQLPGQAAPNWGPVGRWFWHLRDGQVFHEDIAESEPYKYEVALGWIGHYVVGIVYGIVFALYGGAEWFANPSFLPAWIFGILTVAAGWFLLQPGLGIGWAASRLPHARRVRVLNLVAHTFFALGMYATALLIKTPIDSIN
ncbi:DUF2938 domain-containing protein [Falsochrobactrum sp. TDYN1]|uniref:DUF2938 domain-containing protein n=1 Tax=Falsochrobactrum tianjinense TaxID=2706015 RepID=A0A949PLF3_9HYPH|nr:DUF2938 domain-containing protein [Falsochrobactrum sp. TDYN1]MBV2143213.1 DUF2938 domain-containing protein [Falsochrobactrum sp. TDYN1]